MKKDIRNYNKAGQYHGYQEWYTNSNCIHLQYRGIIQNGRYSRYQEIFAWDEIIYSIR